MKLINNSKIKNKDETLTTRKALLPLSQVRSSKYVLLPSKYFV